MPADKGTIVIGSNPATYRVPLSGDSVMVIMSIVKKKLQGRERN